MLYGFQISLEVSLKKSLESLAVSSLVAAGLCTLVHIRLSYVLGGMEKTEKLI